MISSPEVDKFLRRDLSPIIREDGFQKVSARKACCWRDQCVLVFQIRAVGSYFSDVTGWPPMSVGAWTGVYYDFIPVDRHRPPKIDLKGRLIPDEWQCHLRSHLCRTLDQSRYTERLSNPAERVRKDIWWLERSGSNIEEVVENMVLCFMDQAAPWFQRFADLSMAFSEIEAGHDCYTKYYQAEWFAKALGLERKHKMYAELRIQEGNRIGLQIP